MITLIIFVPTEALTLAQKNCWAVAMLMMYVCSTRFLARHMSLVGTSTHSVDRLAVEVRVTAVGQVLLKLKMHLLFPGEWINGDCIIVWHQ